MAHNKLIVLGLDGLDPDVLDRLLPELPNFRRLAEEGAIGADADTDRIRDESGHSARSDFYFPAMIHQCCPQLLDAIANSRPGPGRENNRHRPRLASAGKVRRGGKK